MRLVHELGTSLPVPPTGAREYNRAIAGALLEGARSHQPARWSWKLPLALTAAAAIAIVVALSSNDSPPRMAQPAPAPPLVEVPSPLPAPATPDRAPEAPTDVVEAGELIAPSS